MNKSAVASATKRSSTVALAVAAIIVATSPAPTRAQTEITEQEAHAIGVDAYLYFYSLVTMDLTRLQSTNMEPGKEPLKGPMNMHSSPSQKVDCQRRARRPSITSS